MASSTLPVWSACIASTPPWKGGASHGKLHTSSVECLHCQYPTLERWGFAWQAPHFQCGVLASPVPHLGKVGLRTASSTLPVWSACIASTPPWKGGASHSKLHTSSVECLHCQHPTLERWGIARQAPHFSVDCPPYQQTHSYASSSSASSSSSSASHANGNCSAAGSSGSSTTGTVSSLA